MALRPQQVAPELLNKVTKALGITALDQWYYVTHHTATKAIGSRLLSKFGGNLASFLQYAYPQHYFDEQKLASRNNLEKEQKFIEVIIRQLFPNTEIHTKARKLVGIINPETEAYLEIDFWIPSLKLGIEYQDKHHFEYQWYANDSLEDYQKRDDIKKAAMSTKGYTLITIGYWWDKSIDSIAATIRQHRPDLLQNYENNSSRPIPSDPPPSHITESYRIPGVAGIMSPFVPTNKFNPINWFAGEKHDGIRGVYNPKLSKIFSRSGNELSVIPSLLKDIPNILIEGEIIAGRGNYNKTAVVSFHTLHDKVNWSMLRYIVFDIPDSASGNYKKRYSIITRELSHRSYIFAQSAFRVLLMSKAHLRMLVDAIISDAGEGVIAQQNAVYEYGRAKGLAKIKVRRDADAQVLHINKLSCTCKLASGITADMYFSDNFDSSNLKVGDIISFYHNGYSQSGIPKRGEIYKVRYDITWEEIFGNKAKRRSFNEAIGTSALVSRDKVRNKLGYWNKPENIRAFFDEFARTAGFNPSEADSWYPVRISALRKAGGSSVLSAYNYNIEKSLSRAYPELRLDNSKFITHQTKVKNGHWNNPLNVRAFFDEFALASGFDPLVAENWYLVRITALRSAGGDGLLHVYGNSVNTALSFAYPELKFEARQFITHQTKVQHGHWKKSENVRAYFNEFALTSGFDPHVAENWYQVRINTMRNAGGDGLLNVYGFNMHRALSCAYPELQLEANSFVTHHTKLKNGHWNESANVRAYFDDFAKTAGFDPLVPENWYPVRCNTLRNAGGSSILAAHSHNIAKALSCAYPELEFHEQFITHDKTKVRFKMGHWSESPSNVRAFFDNFAQISGFDQLVPENWYPVRGATVRNSGGAGLLHAFGFNLMQALSFGYPELKFEAAKFITNQSKVTKGHWNESANVRAFFDEFANTAGFDPLVHENWHSVSINAFRKAGGAGLLAAHDHNVTEALSYAYPELKRTNIENH